MKYKSSSYCPNCHFPLPYKGKFCARCGQKTSNNLLTVRSLFKQLWYRVLHLESRSLRFMLLLFIPGYVTKEFFSGRQKRFPQPIRFFFIVMFLFLFTVNHLSETEGLNTNVSLNGIKVENNSQEKFKNLNFYELGKRYAEHKKMRQEVDSLPEAYRVPVAQLAIDSLLNRSYANDVSMFTEIMNLANEDSTKTNVADSIPLALIFKEIKIATHDAFLSDADAIIIKYNITGWLDKLLLRQGLKTLKDPSALMHAYLGSLVWTMLTLLGFMAGVLTLLYWKQKRYYVEHFIFLLHEHSAQFLLISTALWINEFFPLGYFWIPLVLWMLLSPFLGMRRFYHQKPGILLLKYFVFSVLYIVGFIILFMIGMIVVFMIF